MDTAVYEICIDWDGDGDFLDAGEDVTSAVLVNETHQIIWTRGMENLLDLAQASSLEFYLTDPNGIYSPEYDPNVKPGRSVRLRATYGVTTYDLWHGKIDNVIPHPRLDEQVTYFYCLDGMDYLASVDIRTPLYINKTESYIVNDMLDQAGWPSGAGNRTIGDSVALTYGTTEYGLWWHHIKALPALQEFEQITRGRFYVSHEGKAVWESREYRSKNKATSAATFNGSMVQIHYEYSRKMVYNEVIANIQSAYVTGPYAECMTAIWTVPGTLSTGVNKSFVISIPREGLIGYEARANVKAPAPTGADILIDINYDGTTIFTDQSNRLRIPAGTTTVSTTDLDVTAYADNKLLTIDIDQVGSTIAGSWLTVELICTRRLQ